MRNVLLKIFSDKPISQVKVSEIVEALQMSRGIFYKYFEDLNDAYDYLIHDSANKVHGRILRKNWETSAGFFQRIGAFLVEALEYGKDSEEYKELQLLIQNSYLFSYRSEDPHGAAAWKKVLTANKFRIESQKEADSFLFLDETGH